MFTTPDNADAVLECPPFDPPGPNPQGFFKDCKTIPTAEDFNELIVNLRGLVWQANQLGLLQNKGDPEILWRSILKLPLITYPQNIYVSPSGSPNPSHPQEGDPFSSIDRALDWLAQYRITIDADVSIMVAAGVYNHDKPLVIDHPDGNRIDVIGAGSATILSFLGPFTKKNGVVVPGHLRNLSNLEIHGNNQPGTTGLEIPGGHLEFLHNVTVRYWGSTLTAPSSGAGVVVRANGYLGFGTLIVEDTGGEGILCWDGGQCQGQVFWGFRNGLVNAPYYVASVSCTTGGRAWIDSILTNGSHQGVRVSGSGSELRVRALQVQDSVNVAAVEANDSGAIINMGNEPNSWTTWNVTSNTPQYFYANVYGLIRADGALTAANRANASPAVNIVGNVQSYILAS